MLIKIHDRQAWPVIILTHCLGLLENCLRVSSFECLPGAQGAEFAVTWDYFVTSVQSTDGCIFWGTREGCALGQQEQKELQCEDYIVWIPGITCLTGV